MELEQALRAEGRRVTRPRRLVWEVLRRSDSHLSAQEIADRVNRIEPVVNRSSVYRALSVLAELGLVRESRLSGADHPASTWEVTHDDEVIHLVCQGCGEVQHHHTDAIERLRHSLRSGPGFRSQSVDVRVSGRCRSCAVA